jgi:hypothetical protein
VFISKSTLRAFSSRLAFSDAAEKPSGRRSFTLDAITEITPSKDLRDVSTFLKYPLSPGNSASNQSPLADASLVPLPPSPAKSLIEHLPHVPVQSVVRQFREQEILQRGNELVISLRSVSTALRTCVQQLYSSRSSFSQTLATFGLLQPLSSCCIFYHALYRGRTLK